MDPNSSRLQLLEPFKPWDGKDIEVCALCPAKPHSYSAADLAPSTCEHPCLQHCWSRLPLPLDCDHQEEPTMQCFKSTVKCGRCTVNSCCVAGRQDSDQGEGQVHD